MPVHTPRQVTVWDLPLRLFHWALALSIVLAVLSGKVGGNWMDLHARIGLAITGLLMFRLTWGFVGSTYARFAQFAPTPGRLKAYLRGEWQHLGHNPLGACSVFALLGLIALQLTTGLLANDDIAFRGPLYELVGKDLSDQLTGWHKQSSNLLLALVALHVAAIVFYLHVRKRNLIRPMITGQQELPGAADAITPPATPARQSGNKRALLLAIALAALAIWGASGNWIDWISPPPPPVATPAW